MFAVTTLVNTICFFMLIRAVHQALNDYALFRFKIYPKRYMFLELNLTLVAILQRKTFKSVKIYQGRPTLVEPFHQVDRPHRHGNLIRNIYRFVTKCMKALNHGMMQPSFVTSQTQGALCHISYFIKIQFIQYNEVGKIIFLVLLNIDLFCLGFSIPLRCPSSLNFK